MNPLRIIDLFAGCGGFSQGFKNLESLREVKIELAIDILDDALATFKRNIPEANCISGDIRNIRRRDLESSFNIKRGDIDIIIGGPPCQGFSSIRPFRSSKDDDPRNNLFLEYASFVNYFRPKFFVLENVVGLATHADGETIEIMQDTFTQIGYDTDWKILNAANYGVPQKRERLFMIGTERGGSIEWSEPIYRFQGNTIGYRDKKRVIRLNDAPLFASLAKEAVSVLDAISDLPFLENGGAAEVYDKEASNEYQAAMRRKDGNRLTWHSSTHHSEKMMEIIRYSGSSISNIPKHLITSGFSTSYSRLTATEPSSTITVNFVHPASNKCIHPEQDRALTPREGARIQSFTDEFEFVGKRSQVVKQIGNAVPPILCENVAKMLLKHF